jgi:[acyl-carrier-protein] S-malonyltransferase
MPRVIGLLFSGQGAQQVGMGKDLSQHYASAANLFSEADRRLKRSLSQVAFTGPIEELTKTANCQVTLYVHGIALLQVLREELGKFTFQAAAGLSLGEFTAHAAAGTFDFGTGLQLVDARSRLMEEACLSTKGTMAAFVGGEETAVREVAQEADVDVANLNSPGQIVLSGATDNIQRAIGLAKEKGIRRAVPLNVAGAFHSRLMASARTQLIPVLESVAIKSPDSIVIANVTAAPVKEPAEVRQTLADQVTGSVRWVETINYLLDNVGCNLLIELGPGQVLAGLVGRIRKGTEVISIENLTTLQDALPLIRAAGD